MADIASESLSPNALKLILVAERLFADHGIDGVSLRQVAAEAGSGNNSAVHYHFGSKQGLVAAILRHRLPQLVHERRMLAAVCDTTDLRSRLEAHFLPVFALAERADNRYVSFVEQIQRLDPTTAGGLLELPPDAQSLSDGFHADVFRLIDHLDPTIAQMRLEVAQSMCIHVAAARDRAIAREEAMLPFEFFTNSLLDGLAGLLRAPASQATMIRLGDTSLKRGH